MTVEQARGPSSTPSTAVTQLERSSPSFRLATPLAADHAHEHVSILLGYIHHLIEQGDLEDDHKLLGAATYLSALAKTIMDDIDLAELPAP